MELIHLSEQPRSNRQLAAEGLPNYVTMAFTVPASIGATQSVKIPYILQGGMVSAA